uniref:Swi5-dependent recombination DNA repair protein 1 homolog n=1 Tax=Chrysemys picta bellii TaxID=8478 RepID=A0A8C3IJM9_CHRPI|nr:swi5-dependent recombination DNA repair protein 1 homolog [Chrysemys picta bellii]XP_008177983.1 swi5-dependent recombination DNA repair protein 1 homolog [Chrysemys picta bellii]XP_042711143.1 swi5-dependent recombination DNA repair protein 1 homolog [Chrysemys picta bellii]
METPLSDKSTSLCSTPEDRGTLAPQSTGSGKKPMSTTLKERLKKARRSFNSSFTVAKCLKVDIEEKDYSTSEEGALLAKESCSRLQNSCEILEENCAANTSLSSPVQERHCCRLVQNSPHSVVLGADLSQQELLEEKLRLLKQVQEKKDLLRRLKLVKMYRSKNNPSELQSLITKWRCSTQLMLYELQSALSTDGNKLSLTLLIDNFGLEDKLLHYSRTEEDFTDM